MLIEKVEKKFFLLGPTIAVCDVNIRQLCLLPYDAHPLGCPNYGKKPGCPPKAPYFPLQFDSEVLVAAVRFDIGYYAELRKLEHPDWTNKALRNIRHWQGHVRSELRKFIAAQNFSNESKVLYAPEAMGVNITETCKQIGIDLEWPPNKYTHIIALVTKRIPI
jgi:hypothetical protein